MEFLKQYAMCVHPFCEDKRDSLFQSFSKGQIIVPTEKDFSALCENEYFDDLTEYIKQLANETDFINQLIPLENEVCKEVQFLTGDRDFPAVLRETILQNIALSQIEPGEGLLPSATGKKYAIHNRRSLMVELIYPQFQNLHAQNVKCYFGQWSGNPRKDTLVRNEHWKKMEKSEDFDSSLLWSKVELLTKRLQQNVKKVKNHKELYQIGKELQGIAEQFDFNIMVEEISK